MRLPKRHDYRHHRYMDLLPPRWVFTAIVCVLVVLALFLELNLLGVTNFPFKTVERSPRQDRLARVLRSAESQCRFGNALVSAGAAGGRGRDREIRPVRFARSYANSFAGTTEDERVQIRAACLQGLTMNDPSR